MILTFRDLDLVVPVKDQGPNSVDVLNIQGILNAIEGITIASRPSINY